MYHLPILSDDDLAEELLRQRKESAGLLWLLYKRGRDIDSAKRGIALGETDERGYRSKARFRLRQVPITAIPDYVPSHHNIGLDDLIEIADLTERELSVLAMAREGMTETEIGNAHGVTHQSVSRWLSAILSKLRQAVVTLEQS